MSAPKSEVRVTEVHTITKPVWDMTGGEKRARTYLQNKGG